jgi:hypothetical protein
MSEMTSFVAESQLKDLAKEWKAGELRGDAAFMERTLADDFLAIGPRGYMLNKGDWLARYRSGDLKYDSVSLDDVRVRMYGDAAIVTGIEWQKGKYQNQPITGQLRTTMIWVRNQSDWLLAGMQMSPIAPVP